MPEQNTATDDNKKTEIDGYLQACKSLNALLHDNIVAMQSAYIEWKHGRGIEAAMEWIENTLDGPGLIPDEAAPYGKEAQAWYDANQSNPMPTCFCGRPSNIAWMKYGFCCNEHAEQKKAEIKAATPAA